MYQRLRQGSGRSVGGEGRGGGAGGEVSLWSSAHYPVVASFSVSAPAAEHADSSFGCCLWFAYALLVCAHILLLLLVDSECCTELWQVLHWLEEYCCTDLCSKDLQQSMPVQIETGKLCLFRLIFC